MIPTSEHNGDLQAAIDAALATGDNVYVDKVAPLLKTALASNFDGVKFNQVTIDIVGDSHKSDNGKKSVISAKFNDGPILAIQEGKGCVIRGLNLQGPSIGRDSRYSPQAGIAIDPVSYLRPADGGYANMEYKGDASKGGSTGVRILDCTTNNTTVGIITSPNGHTQNADNIAIIDHRFGNHTYGLAGCQDQEKGNVIEHFQAWGKMKCLFQFNTYGAQKPGQWISRGGNIAGNVESVIYRQSTGYYPFILRDLFAESIKNIGFWETQLTDLAEGCTFHLNAAHYPNYTIGGGGVTLNNNIIRYYGKPTRVPILMYNAGYPEANNKFLGHADVLRIQRNTKHADVTISTATPAEGKTVIFYQPSNYTFLGSGVVVGGVIKTDFDQTIPHRRGIYKMTASLPLP